MSQFYVTVIIIYVYSSLTISLRCSHRVRWPSFRAVNALRWLGLAVSGEIKGKERVHRVSTFSASPDAYVPVAIASFRTNICVLCHAGQDLPLQFVYGNVNCKWNTTRWWITYEHGNHHTFKNTYKERATFWIRKCSYVKCLHNCLVLS
jgi:hypothetical protein